MSCGALILGSNTAPVQEVVREGFNGHLCEFFDVDALVAKALKMLAAPLAYKHLQRAARESIEARYTLDACLPQMLKMYESVVK